MCLYYCLDFQLTLTISLTMLVCELLAWPLALAEEVLHDRDAEEGKDAWEAARPVPGREDSLPVGASLHPRQHVLLPGGPGLPPVQQGAAAA